MLPVSRSVENAKHSPAAMLALLNFAQGLCACCASFGCEAMGVHTIGYSRDVHVHSWSWSTSCRCTCACASSPRRQPTFTQCARWPVCTPGPMGARRRICLGQR